ncbi:TauD/TfdA family dioxygenase [Streptomyces sp. NPDC101166]|uniref:TauD/TfdA family dioxygenase n=1 Tax=Streptomyces sp. NPDC101166 TaxID=3366120 RepID=UPI003822D8E5
MTEHVVILDGPELAAARSRVLDPGHRYPFPAVPRRTGPGHALAELVPAASADGVAAVLLERPLPPEEFLTLGEALGHPVPETAPAVRHRVTAGRILDLVTDTPETADIDQQPFAAGRLLVHSESSARPLARQPRYLLFQCLSAAASPIDGQTIVIPFDRVADRLDPVVITLLTRLRYRGARHALARVEEGRTVFSFRDPGPHPLVLDADPGVTAQDVRAAVTALCAAAHHTETVSAVPWQPGLLVLLDNHRAFHGRTRSSTQATGRHLQRLRIVTHATRHPDPQTDRETRPIR